MVKDIVIVGGGAAGWMTAINLLVNINNLIEASTITFGRPPIKNKSIKNFDNIKVTLIASEDIPVIGVGEGTLPDMQHFLGGLNLNVDDINGTKKLGIEYINWYSKSSGSWYHPFTFGDFDTHYNNLFYKYKNNNLTFEEVFSDIAVSKEKHGCHIEVSKLISKLKSKCIDMGCNFITNTVKDCKFNDDKSIKSVILNDNTEIRGDYFVDCTGFRRVLMSKMETTFIDLSDKFLCNSAIATHIDLKNEKEYHWTKCTALSSGWVWNIPLQDKVGIGYVYSDKFISDDDAKKELNEYLNIEGDYQLLKWTPGILKEPFVKNCAAVGLSAGFIEPMEATNHGAQSLLISNLVNILDGINNKRNIDIDRINEYIRTWYDNIGNFILSNYFLSKRIDSNFWQYFNNTELPKDIKNIINMLFEMGEICGHPNVLLAKGAPIGQIAPTNLSWFVKLVGYHINYKTGDFDGND